MTTYVLSDSTTMLRRTLLRIRRYPSMTVLLVGMPVIFLLLFVYVFGGTLGAGLPGGGNRGAYIDFVVPGILLMTVASVAQGTAISVAMDKQEGIVDRFRTMAVARSALLTGHVLGAVVQTVVVLLVVTGVAVGIGLRPVLDPLAWLAALGVLLALTVAITWICVALGLVSDSIETASNLPMPLVFLPFLGSGFVPTDSMPAGLRWFAEHQPFTPAMDAVRSLLLDGQFTTDIAVSLTWTVVISAAAAMWAVKAYAHPNS